MPAPYSDAAPDSIWTAGVFTGAGPGLRPARALPFLRVFFVLRGAGAAARAFRVALADGLEGVSFAVFARCPSMRPDQGTP